MEKDSGKWIMYGVDWDDPQESWNTIVRHTHDVYPIATNAQIKKLLK